MDFNSIEKKWQKKWADTNLYKFDKNDKDNKYYVLEMFSYPSGAKLHVGHWYNYGPSDSFARYMRMKGKNVFQPMGFDAFGLPAENYAIKTGIHPKDSTLKNIETMEGQLKAIGATFSWENEIKTCVPEYYKWTQWIFLTLYKNGLAYRKEAPVNWCPSCNTVLANEQVVDGKCERCGTEVVRKNLTQWFFKITDYSERLLQGLDNLDWPEKTKLMQRNWIGKSTGGEIEFSTTTGEKFKVFTTRADTLFGVSYVVLAPEHPLVEKLTTSEQLKAVNEYKDMVSKTKEIDRLSTTREKTGVWTGAYAINPINNKKVQIWIADYVLFSYGTGAVMGVPAHDERDFAFATKYGLPIERVIKGKDGNDELPFVESGILINSDKFNGLVSEDAQLKIIEELNKMGKGELKTNYRLRDWLVSRQRYWGAPIPVIHCPHCGIVPVEEKDLPVELPYDVDFKPDGKSPLAKHDGFMHVKCPICGADATRDPDTLDTFVCSSWYFLRYPDANNNERPFDSSIVNEMLPVDKYVGGAEHACMHLLYARFITMVLHDLGYINFDEPFKSLVHQGTILGPDGQRMSKSKGNVVNPDDFVSQYGSDAFRIYLMFGFNYIEGGPWNDDGIKSTAKFLDRVERLVQKYIPIEEKGEDINGKEEQELKYVLANTIKEVDKGMESFSFNTAVARLMELVNALYKYDANPSNTKLMKDSIKSFLLLLAPCAPHFAEEMWEQMGLEYSIFNQKFPVANEKDLVKQEIELAVQINSKMKGKINVPNGSTNEEIEKIALSDEKINALLEGKTPKKVIVVPGRLINFIV